MYGKAGFAKQIDRGVIGISASGSHVKFDLSRFRSWCCGTSDLLGRQVDSPLCHDFSDKVDIVENVDR